MTATLDKSEQLATILDNVRKLGPNRALILDSHGLRYLVPDAQQLDSHSRRLMARYLS